LFNVIGEVGTADEDVDDVGDNKILDCGFNGEVESCKFV
jgi:hypothetical protein